MTTIRYILILSFIFTITLSHSQVKFPQQELNNLSRQALNRNSQTKTHNSELITQNFKSGIRQLLSKYNNYHLPIFQSANLPILKSGKSDTMYVLSDMTITGAWSHSGTIVVGPGATLFFKHANATILGDIVTWGDGATLSIDSSYMYFPQQYFYQRSLIAVLKSFINISNSTLDYSDLSHNLVANDNAVVTMKNVTLKGFTTNGVWGSASINIDGTNQAGEYITTDKCKLDFKNATTILLWHHFADTALINFSFPKGDVVSTYIFNRNVQGVKGVGYNIKVTNSKDVMWGLMPSTGSDVTITGSKLRAIGLWFMGSDTIDVSGLVDNSKYTDFIAPVTDRNLHLINSSVQTWSIYPMENAKLNVSGCIVGEMGSGGSSSIMGSSFYVDGSGGYFWSDGTSFTLAGWCTATTYVRSQNQSIFLFGYSALTNGIASAIGNSVLIVTQSSLPQDPVALEGAVAWFANINQPQLAYVGDNVSIIGSAWIDKGPVSLLMDFNYYSLYYQKANDTVWKQIGADYGKEVRNSLLGTWDTKGLEPGQYNLKLALTDNTNDKNTVEAIKSVNLLPAILDIDDNAKAEYNLQLINDPVNKSSILTYQIPRAENVSITLYDGLGRKLKTLNDSKQAEGAYTLSFETSRLSSGIYFLRFQSTSHIQTLKMLK